jgi:hypothetical protein
MQARSTCGARPYKQFLDAGCYRWYSEHQPLLHMPVEGCTKGWSWTHLPHICGDPLVAYSSCEVGPCGPSGTCGVVVGGFSTTLEV